MWPSLRNSITPNGAPFWPNPMKALLSHDGEYIGIFASRNTPCVGLVPDIHCELPSIKCRSIWRFIESNSEEMLESWAKLIEVSKFTMVNSLISTKEAAYKALPVNLQPASLKSLEICNIHKPNNANAWEFDISHPHFPQVRAHVVRTMSIIFRWRG